MYMYICTMNSACEAALALKVLLECAYVPKAHFKIGTMPLVAKVRTAIESIENTWLLSVLFHGPSSSIGAVILGHDK